MNCGQEPNTSPDNPDILDLRIKGPRDTEETADENNPIGRSRHAVESQIEIPCPACGGTGKKKTRVVNARTEDAASLDDCGPEKEKVIAK